MAVCFIYVSTPLSVFIAWPFEQKAVPLHHENES